MDLLKDNQGVIWTSPDGKVFYLKTLDNEFSLKHIGEVKENPRPKNSKKKKIQDSNDTFTDSGIGGKDISLTCYFIGSDHISKSKEFVKALCLTGQSKLKLVDEDEITVNVLRLSVKRSLVKNKNCSIISVEFHETAKNSYPESAGSKVKEIKNISEKEKANISQNLSDTVNTLSNTAELQSFEDDFSSALEMISDDLSLMNNVSLKSIMTDILYQSPLSNIYTISSQLGIIFYKASLLGNNIQDSAIDIISGDIFGNWSSLISNLISKSYSQNEKLTKKEINKLLINDSIASMAIISFGESLLEKKYETRLEAVEAAKTLKELEEKWTEFIDDELKKISNLEDIITRNENLSSIIDNAANEILDLSYKLKVEQIIILNEDTTTIDIAYTYYSEDFEKDPDKTLNYLITTNNFTDDEFFLLRKGSQIKIYV